MRAIILAAGQGTRLGPHTETRPKCLVEIAGLPILAHQRKVLQQCGLGDITVVTGYRAAEVQKLGLCTVHNPNFAGTNMVASLMCARHLLDGSDDVLIVYGDILFERRVIAHLAACEDEVGVAVNRAWLSLWRARMEDPLADAETLRVGRDGMLLEIGKKPRTLEEIEAQYMGLVRIHRFAAPRWVREFERQGAPSGMFMTTFLQHLIDEGWKLRAVPTDGGWIEIDTVSDLELYRRLHAAGELNRFWKVHE